MRLRCYIGAGQGGESEKTYPSGTQDGSGHNAFALARYLHDGRLDTNFGPSGDGTVNAPPSSSDSPHVVGGMSGTGADPRSTGQNCATTSHTSTLSKETKSGLGPFRAMSAPARAVSSLSKRTIEYPCSPSGD